MCFQVYDKHPVKHIAEEHITVYKILDKLLSEIFRCPVSLIQGFKYKLHKLYTLPEELEVLKSKYNERLPINRTTYSIYKGFHSYAQMPRAENPYLIAECIIPKGSVYYQNGNEIVSNQIIVIKTYLSNVLA